MHTRQPILWALDETSGQPIYAGAARRDGRYRCPASGESLLLAADSAVGRARYEFADGTRVARPAYARAVTKHLIADRIRWWARGSTAPKLLKGCQHCQKLDQVDLPDGRLVDTRLDIAFDDGLVVDVALLDREGKVQALILLHEGVDEPALEISKLARTGLPWIVLPVMTDLSDKDGTCFWLVLWSRQAHVCGTCAVSTGRAIRSGRLNAHSGRKAAL